MSFRHTAHLLQHGYHFTWLTIGLTILLFGLVIWASVRRGQRRSGQSSAACRPAHAAPWHTSTVNQPAAAPWQSGMASAPAPRYGQPVYASAPWAPCGSASAWNAPRPNSWPAPVAAPRWMR